MGSIKVWDGTAWQTASMGPSLPPVTSVDGRTGAVSLSDLYQSAYGDWTVYTPVFGSENNLSGAGMTPGTGGGCIGWYRMIAPYTMALWIRFQWGSTGANGGNADHLWSMPAGYTASANTHQYTPAIFWTGDNFVYAGYATFLAGSGYARPGAPYADPTARWIGNLVRVKTGSGTPPMHPQLWYPSGGMSINGVIGTTQRT